MRKNTLNIQWGGEMVNLTPTGQRESFKTKSIESAKKIIGNRKKDNMQRAIFTDGTGKETKII